MSNTEKRRSLMDDLDMEKSAKPTGGKSTERRKIVSIGVGVVAALVAFVLVARLLFSGGPDAKSWSQQRTVIDSQTLEVFVEFKIPDGEAFPYEHPKTGDRTLFPAEACNWTADGGVKMEATWVLLNEYVDNSEPTKCPDCGRRVVGHNPSPPVDLMIAEHNRETGGG